MQSKPKKTQRTIRTAKHLLTVALVALTLTSCCKIKSQWVTVVEEGYLYTPEGKHPFKQISYSKLKRINPAYQDQSPAPKTYMMAETDSFTVIADPASGGTGSWRIYPKNDLELYKDITIDSEVSFFETKHHGSLVKSGKAARSYVTFIEGSSRRKQSIAFRTASIPSMIDSNSMKDHTFRYAIPFSMNKTKYKMDVTISFGHSSYLNCSDWHVPGSP
jgi:hypothetical protein